MAEEPVVELKVEPVTPPVGDEPTAPPAVEVGEPGVPGEETPPAGEAAPVATIPEPRFKEVYSKWKDSEREAEFWKTKALQTPIPPAAPVAPVAPVVSEPAISPKPSKESFRDQDGYEDQEAYYEALADWKVDVRLAKEEHKRTQERIQDENTRKAQEATEFVAKVSQKYPDFPVMMQSTPISDSMADALLTADNSVEIAYHLARNPAEAMRISRLSPMAAAREIGKLDGKFSIPSPAPKKITNAPQPITPVSQTGKTEVVPEHETNEEYQARKNREEFGEPKRE